MGRGRSENHPVAQSMSRRSTVGVLRRASSDLLIHRGNGSQGKTQNESLGKWRHGHRIGLLSAEASLVIGAI